MNNALEKINQLDQELTTKKRTPLRTLNELLDMEYPETVWIANNVIPEGITLFTGASASFKTYFLLHLANCIASGEKFLGYFDTMQRGVLYIDEENGHVRLGRRFKNLQATRSERLLTHSFNGYKIDEEESVLDILDLCRKHNIKVVVLDSLVRLHSGDENSAPAMSQALTNLNVLKAAGISVIIIHHHRKQQAGARGGQDSIRGSSDIFAYADCHIAVERDNDSVTFIQNKSRDEEEFKPFKVEIVSKPGSIGFVYSGNINLHEEIDNEVYATIQMAVCGGTEVTMEFLKTECSDYSKVKLTSSLKRLEACGKITLQRKKSNKFIYGLPESSGNADVETSN